MDLGKVLILGGTSGVGIAIAKAILVRGGQKVVISSSKQSRVEQAIAHLGSANVTGKACQLNDPSALEKNITELLAFANVDDPVAHIIITSGEIFKPESIQEFDPCTTFEHWTVRYLTILTVAKHAPPSLKSLTTTTAAGNPAGRPSTIAGIVGAIEALTKSLAVEIAPVRVNCVALGTFETPLTALVTSSEAGSASVQQSLQRQVIPRMGQPEEAAEAYLYFMRDSFQTGCILTVDGGRQLK